MGGRDPRPLQQVDSGREGEHDCREQKAEADAGERADDGHAPLQSAARRRAGWLPAWRRSSGRRWAAAGFRCSSSPNQAAASARATSRTATANNSRSQSASTASRAGAGERANADHHREQEQEERMECGPPLQKSDRPGNSIRASLHCIRSRVSAITSRTKPTVARAVIRWRDAGHRRDFSLTPTDRPTRHWDAAHQRPPARDAVQHSGAARAPDAASPTCMRAPARWGSRRSAAARRSVVCGEGGAGAGGYPRQFEGAADCAGLCGGGARDGSAAGAAGEGCESLRKPDELLDLVYLDPPWEAEAEYAKTLQLLGSARGRAMLAPGAMVVAEHSSKAQLAERFGELVQTRTLKQGDAALTFYAVTAD